jgi:alanyl-tRNA synthetase
MKTNEVRNKYLNFFKARGHAIVPSAPIVPDNDPTTLFTGSGMQPMLSYFLGESHPEGTRVANSQKCFRAEDIKEVGDNRHTTFFEMLGNWSFGDYFKKDQLRWVFEFLVNEIELDPEKLYISVFAGDEEFGIPRDEESANIWRELFDEKGIDAKIVHIGSQKNGDKVGMQGGRIFYYNAEKNWWSRSGGPADVPAGEPGGPDSEIFYDFGEDQTDPNFHELKPHPNSDSGRFMEIGNSVFMEYVKVVSGSFDNLPNKNVDFGGGLERITAASENTPDIFKIDIFKGVIASLEDLSSKKYDDLNVTASFRIIADHIRGAVFMIADGVLPSNIEAGYFTRRLIRRAVRHMDKLGVHEGSVHLLVNSMIENYKSIYPDLELKKEQIIEEMKKEELKFRDTLKKGLNELNKIKGPEISGKEAFVLFSSYGFPVEMTEEIAYEKNMTVDKEGFHRELSKHQELSRAGANKRFKGGLSGVGEKQVKYHTATHILNQSLRKVLGEHVTQKGSNITEERLRYDFSHDQKLTESELKQIEQMVNEAITSDLSVTYEEMPLGTAIEKGAIGVFGDRYSEMVKVYKIQDSRGETFSLEICGGPHVNSTAELGKFKIIKEESVSLGVRRIKAVLE